MEQKNSKIFNEKNMQAVSAYCSANNIEDINDFIYKCFRQGFDIEKYGFLGKTGGIEEKQVEIEVIREIRVEVPVEVIKEVEKIVEVPVEVIKEVPVEKVVLQEVIKEVPVEIVVEKIIKTSDDTQINELLSKIQQLNGEISIKCVEIDNIRQEFSTKTEEMENKISKKDKELDELRHNLDIPVTNDKVNMLQTTVQNLTSEVRELKKKNEELEKKLLEQPKESDFTKARFHGSSNLNNDLYR